MVTRGWGAVVSIPPGEALLDPDEVPAGGLFDVAFFVDAGGVSFAAASFFSGADEPETHENGAIVA